ncbi:recombinase family protein, partial [Modestobacter versicolor]|uniref:recombinase family protein n=1 Tax=Modestobacter versicolor TaxID=429133 RepID=UPI0034DF6636
DIDAANVYADEGKSGKSFKGRESWLTLSTILKRGDVLYVYGMDRISRDMVDQLTVLKDLVDGRKVKIVTTDGDQAYGMYEGIKAAFAQEQRKYISDRTKAGMQAAKEAGKQIGRVKNVELHTRIQELYKQGMKKSQIARELSVSRPTIDKALNNI